MSNSVKTVGIITIHRILNYGSILQTFATWKVIKRLGFAPQIIDYLYPTEYHIYQCLGGENNKQGKFTLRRLIRNILLGLGFGKVLFRRRQRLNYSKTAVRQKKFDQFMKRMDLTCPCDRKTILKKPPFFDIYLTGSDQTWNPRYCHHDYSYLLNFAPDHAPKIAYSASYGATEMLDGFKDDYARLLKRYDAISVREHSGIALTRKLTGKEAQHVLDPTLLFSPDEWMQEITQTSSLPEKFIFCYCLDYVFDPGPAFCDLMEHIARLLQCPVILFSGNKQYQQFATDHQWQIANDIGPEEFLELYSKAAFVLTTSFHGAAFSVNFRKDFYAVLNPNKKTLDNRVLDLLNSVELGSRGIYLDRCDLSRITKADLVTDHTKSAEILEQRRKESLAFLKNALLAAKEKAEGGNVE